MRVREIVKKKKKRRVGGDSRVETALFTHPGRAVK